MPLINFIQLADALDIDGNPVQNVWEAEDDQTGELVLMYFDLGTSPADAQSQMGDADTAESPPPDPIQATEPKWQYNTETKEYCVFGDDGLKLFALKRDVDGNAVLTMFDTLGDPVPPAAPAPTPEPEWLDLNRSSGLGNQGSIVTGTDIIMDESRGNGLTYNSTTGVVTLKAGKTYRLWATFAVFSIESSDTVAMEWVFDNNNTGIYSGHETRLRPANAASNGSNAGTIEVIHKPTVDTDVKLRCTEYTGSPDAVTMYWERSMATVMELR